MSDPLPTYEQAERAVQLCRATALERFVFEYQPGVRSKAASFRDGLAAVLLAEREACAAVAETTRGADASEIVAGVSGSIAAAIRARGELSDMLMDKKTIVAEVHAAVPGCDCHRCIKGRGETINGLPVTLMRMIVCSECGNKRCPHATDHRLACTNSNEPGQPGSVYQ